MHKQMMYEYFTHVLPCMYIYCVHTTCNVTLLQIYCLHATYHFRTPTTSSKYKAPGTSVVDSLSSTLPQFCKLQVYYHHAEELIHSPQGMGNLTWCGTWHVLLPYQAVTACMITPCTTGNVPVLAQKLVTFYWRDCTLSMFRALPPTSFGNVVLLKLPPML